MPTYEFECKECGKIKEMVMSMNDTEERENMTCDSCGGCMEQNFGVGQGAFVSGGHRWLGDEFHKAHGRDIAESTPQALGISQSELDKGRQKRVEKFEKERGINPNKKIMSYKKYNPKNKEKNNG